MDMVVSFIKGITIYILLSSIITNLTDNKKYKKFVELISGLILMIFIINPLLSVFGYDGSLLDEIESNQILFNYDDELGTIYESEEEREKAILRQYKDSLFEKTNEVAALYGYMLVSADFEIEEDASSAHYGTVKSLNAVFKKESAGEQGKIQVEGIGKIVLETEKDQAPSPEEIMLKNRLSDFYNVSADNINITIQGGNDGG